MTASAVWMRWIPPSENETITREAVCGVNAAAAAVFCVLAIGATTREILDVETAAPTRGTVVISGSQIPTQDTWMGRLTDPSAWSGGQYLGDSGGGRSKRAEERPMEPAFDDDHPAERSGFNRGSYRTVCVRLCAGYFFPISFTTTPARFAKNAAECSARCNSAARLYVYPNPGGEPEQMIGLDGTPYTELQSAFLFRTTYDAACTCKPQPWSHEALARHRAYAEAQEKARTRTVARTARPEQQRTDAPSESIGVGAPERPQGAMLLGADRPQPRASRKADVRPKAGNRGSRSPSGRGDWRHRAFTGD
jgi:hypothetical protein